MPPLNLLLVVVDTLRADHLGAYGYERPTSPHFDALARRGTLFTQAHSVTSWTNPAMAALFTGQMPRTLQPGASTFIAPEQPTLAESLRAGGYATAAFIANPVLAPQLGFGRGFDSYVGLAGWAEGLAVPRKQPAESVNDAALRWLAQRASEPERPWFLYLHYMEPHWPYEPPLASAQRFWRSPDVEIAAALEPLNHRLRERVVRSPEDVRQATDLYDASIAHVDDAIQVVLDRLAASNQLQRTVLCIVADHGEELGDHGRYLHAHTLYEELVRVPLLLLTPDASAARRIDLPVQITDLGRTLLDLTSTTTGAFPGTSLLRRSAQRPLRSELIAAGITATHRRAVLDEGSKLIETDAGALLLFDLGADPREQHDMAATEPQRVTALRQALASEPSAVHEAGGADNAAVRERMRALGYDF